MKKLFLAALLAACVVLPLAAQEVTDTGALTIDISKYRNVSLLNTEGYSKQFIDSSTKVIESNYELEAMVNDMDEFDRIATLDGIPSISTAEEIALLSATAGVINVRPVEAADMLPASDPTLIDLQLGAMLYMKKTAVSFLGGGDPAKYAAEIKFITDRGRVTEADIKNFMAQGIAAAVDERYNRVYVPVRGYYTVDVIYDPKTKNYKLTYNKNENGAPQEITARDLPELEKKLIASGAFRADDTNLIINDKALKIPSYVYSDWVEKGLAKANGVTLIKEAITNFYIAPTKANYDVLLGIYANYWLNGGITGDSFEVVARVCFDNVLGGLSPDISRQIYLAVDSRQVSRNTVRSMAAALIEQDPVYRVFSVQAGIGDGSDAAQDALLRAANSNR